MRRWSIVFIVLGMWAGSLLGPGSSVSAQDEEEAPRWNKHHLQIPMSVTWELNRSDFGKESFVTQTEHFREIWYVELKPGTEMNLISPRATTPIDGFGYESAESEVPKWLVMAQGDFLKLLGIPVPALMKEEEGEVEKLLTLQILDPKISETFTFYESREDYFTVHLEFML